MRKGWRNFWIVCGITAGVGAALCCAGVAMGGTLEAIDNHFPNGIGFHTKKSYIIESTGETDAAIKESFTGIDKIDVEVSCVYLEILESDSASEVTLETSGIDSGLNLRYYQDGNELKIETREGLMWNSNNGYGGSITLYLPIQRIEEIDISSGSGELYAETLWAEELSVDVGAGEGTIDDFSAADVELNCGAGQLTVSGGFDREMEIDCGVGEVILELAGSESSYNYELHCGIGEIRVGDSTYSGIKSEKVVNNGVPRELKIDCGIGDVEVNFGVQH